MSILCLPTEILEYAGSFLDLESLVAFGRAHGQFHNIILNISSRVKVNKPSGAVLDYLRENGQLVHSLDISDWRLFPMRVKETVMHCPNLTELNVLNSKLSFEDLLETLDVLPNLTSLSYSFEKSSFFLENYGVRPSQHEYSSLKNIYVEIQPRYTTLSRVIDFLNMLEAVEIAHVNLIGREFFILLDCPTLKAERWNSLHTFVCSRHGLESGSKSTKNFLRKIFAHHENSSAIEDWIDEDRSCYVYEHGYLNGVVDRRAKAMDNEKVRILKRFRVVDSLDPRSYSGVGGSAQSLRIQASANHLTVPEHAVLRMCLTPSIVELDLSGFHGDFSVEFWFTLTESSPGLESLAMPLCSFLLPEEAEARSLAQCLGQLKLRKLFLKGSMLPPCCGSNCMRRQCRQCFATVQSQNFPQLTGLNDLEELSLHEVCLDAPAFEKIANSKAHTIRLNIESDLDFPVLRKFIQECGNLRALKLWAPNIHFDCRELWEAVAAGESLRQLCLGSKSLEDLKMNKLHRIHPLIPETVGVTHFHGLGIMSQSSVRGRVLGQNSLWRQIFIIDHASRCQHDYQDDFPRPEVTGSKLCNQESFAGYVDLSPVV